MQKRLRIAVIGAGVLGAATANALTERFGEKVLVTVLERHPVPAHETSSRNSGVLHSGIHETPGTFKARFAKDGCMQAQRFAQENAVPLFQCGMLIVASFGDVLKLLKQGPSFAKICRNGRKQDIGMRVVMPWEIKNIEPLVDGIGGIFIPSVAVIDAALFTAALLQTAKRQGAQLFFNEKVRRVSLQEKTYHIETGDHALQADAIINVAGLYADEVATHAGFPYYSITPYRGEYYEIVGKEREYINRLVYPVPIEQRVSKGIHLLKRPDGRLFVGPNTRQVPAKDFYEEDKTPVEIFRTIALRFCPMLKNAEFQWSYSGIRPRAAFVGSKTAINDFIFSIDRHDPFFLNVIGYESPGLSGAMAAGKYISDALLSHHPCLAA